MKVIVENQLNPEDMSLEDFSSLAVGILTASEGQSNPGDPVIRVRQEAFFPKYGTFTTEFKSYRVRHLLPGEKIILEGE